MTIDDTSQRVEPARPPALRGRTPRTRVRGLDAARGFALLGMIIVHLMPETVPSGEPSPVHHFFSGHSAPLFGLLAGVALALITGGADPHRGRRLVRGRVSIAVRAVLLLLVGLALNILPLNVFSILPFYAVLFLAGVLFVGMGVRGLLAWAAVAALGGPVVIHLVGRLNEVGGIVSPDLLELFTDPVEVVLSLVVTGYYPAITWLAFILVGMALGRLNLDDLSVQLRMCVGGAVAAATAGIASELLMFHTGAYGRIVDASSRPEAEVADFLRSGGPLPANTWEWLLTDAPHTNTTFWVIGSGGWAVLMLGAFLLATRIAEKALAPLGVAGSMTFTFYTAHLLLVTFVNVWAAPLFWSVAQILFVIVFGVAWRAVCGQGPLEALMSRTSKGLAGLLVPEPDRAGKG